MCGIAAIFSYGPTAPAVDIEELRAIRDQMAKRGPDGVGSWMSSDARLGLGHRRLAIIGPGEQGAQPMVLERPCSKPGAAIAIAFNGEIYNHVELRRELQAAGHKFRSTCDTEVLLHLYEDCGRNLVDRLRGMFAFALWDDEVRRLLLVRDPYGIKPLYYADNGRQIRIASQGRALLASGSVSRAPDDAGVAAFLIFGNIPEPITAWEDISALPAGTTMLVDQSGAAEPDPFFSLPAELRLAAQAVPPADPAPLVRQSLLESVKAHLVADVDVGVFLSAGIDSGAVLGSAAELAGATTAVTVGFDDFRGGIEDEVSLASTTARLYHAKHVVEQLSSDEVKNAVPEVLQAMDQPSIDGLNTWLVSRAAAGAGLKVALSGLGGDELFGGYSTFVSVPAFHRRSRRISAVPGLGVAIRLALERVRSAKWSPKAAGIVEYGGNFQSAWLLRRALFMPWELGAIIGRDRAHFALEQLDVRRLLQKAVHPDPSADVMRVAALEAGLYMRNQLLRDADWASMAHSVEVRVPLVDVRLLRAVAPCLQTWRPVRPKATLASAPRPPLPAGVTNRVKTGFSVPMIQLAAAALDEPWRGVAPLARPGTSWARRWAYNVIESFGLVQPPRARVKVSR